MGLNPETENNTTKETAPPSRAETDPAMATPPKTPSKTTEKVTNGAAKQTLHPATPSTGQKTATRVTELYTLADYAIDKAAGDASDMICAEPL